MKVLIKGAGDLATGVALRLYRAGLLVAMTELASPSAIRRTVCFSEAVRLGEMNVEGVTARLVPLDGQAVKDCWSQGCVPLVVDPSTALLNSLSFDVLVDAVIAKRNTGTAIHQAPVVIALGPGFEAGTDCHAVIETMRGHDLARTLYHGRARPDTGEPGLVGGQTKKRILRAPCDGIVRTLKSIGSAVQAGEPVATVGGQPMYSAIDGIIRGLLPDGYVATAGMKSGDVDPRRDVNYYTVSDKARALGGAVLEAICRLGGVFS